MVKFGVIAVYQWNTSGLPVEFSGIPVEISSKIWSSGGIPVEYQCNISGIPVEMVVLPVVYQRFQWNISGINSGFSGIPVEVSGIMW